MYAENRNRKIGKQYNLNVFESNNTKINKTEQPRSLWSPMPEGGFVLGLWCLTPLSTIFSIFLMEDNFCFDDNYIIQELEISILNISNKPSQCRNNDYWVLIPSGNKNVDI